MDMHDVNVMGGNLIVSTSGPVAVEPSTYGNEAFKIEGKSGGTPLEVSVFLNDNVYVQSLHGCYHFESRGRFLVLRERYNPHKIEAIINTQNINQIYDRANSCEVIITVGGRAHTHTLLFDANSDITFHTLAMALQACEEGNSFSTMELLEESET